MFSKFERELKKLKWTMSYKGFDIGGGMDNYGGVLVSRFE